MKKASHQHPFFSLLLHAVLPIRPLGSHGVTILNLCLVVFLQLHFFESLLWKTIHIDFICLWLVTIFIEESFAFSVFCALFCSVLIEMHSPVPKGLYGCIYLIVCACIFLIKRNISWYRAFSWVSVVLMVEVFSAFFEVFTQYLTVGEWLSFPLSLPLFLSEVAATLFLTWLSFHLSRQQYRQEDE